MTSQGSRTYTVTAETQRGHKVTFKMHNAGNINEEVIREAAESRLQSLGIPKSLAIVVKVS